MNMAITATTPKSSLEDVRPTPQSVANPQSMFSNGLMSMQNIMLQLTQSGNDLFAQMNKKSEIARDAQEMANQVEAVMSRLVKPGDKLALPESTVAYMRANNILVDGKTIDEFMGERSGAQASLETLMAKIAASGPEGMETRSWQEVITYMDANGITVDGKKASDYVWGLPEVNFQSGKKVSLEHMNTIRQALEDSMAFDKGDLMMVKSSLESVAGRATDFNQQSQLKLQQVMQNFSTSNQLTQSMQSMLAEMTKGTASAIR
ncbi:hypothetical protein ACTJKT_28370 [Pseudomonas sp. 22526]|uniref:hypothetical protein n=1 Tax=Pseudomonas TaxID=286 RepID=UPI0006A594A3|nr:hypothetical protein [Pseudomonas chlororaphis]AZC32412.1 hypothetical protein C4K38_4461 [Pseudomonas chlororaphis subsp. piscium]MBP5078597.1 secretion protein EspA [Pseudomonas chlororaphis]QTT87881.1 secretion protein EspA [Pseudomonas chlororaphis]UCR83672.1 hypothetical protein K9V45_26255 [Pseudomonas chlororaphis]WDG76957.1 hypothetical protein PUP77_21315 [Pseudomonas chlororaphis]